MNVEIGTKAAQFPEKEYISGIFLAVPNGGFSNGCIKKRFSIYKLSLHKKAKIIQKMTKI